MGATGPADCEKSGDRQFGKLTFRDCIDREIVAWEIDLEPRSKVSSTAKNKTEPLLQADLKKLKTKEQNKQGRGRGVLDN